MTTARTCALVLTALIHGPLAAILMAAGLWCFQWAAENERRHGQRKNGRALAAT